MVDYMKDVFKTQGKLLEARKMKAKQVVCFDNLFLENDEGQQTETEANL